jgi:SGNH domain (fused to AT3 domains)
VRVRAEPDVDMAIAGMRQTVQSIRAAGKGVVVVAPPPSADFDIALCSERRHSGLLSLPLGSPCEIDVRTYQAQSANVLRFLDRLPAEAGVDVIRSTTCCAIRRVAPPSSMAP